MKFREVNGQVLVPLETYRMGEYLLVKVPGGPWQTHRVGAATPTGVTMNLVGAWYELSDAVQGALHDRQQRGGN